MEPRRSTARRASSSASSRATKSSTLTSLMEDTQLPKSTAARVLRALERNGLAQRRRGGGFRPGPVLVEYARRDSSVGDLATLAWPFLEQLGQLTGETVNVAIRPRRCRSRGPGRQQSPARSRKLGRQPRFRSTPRRWGRSSWHSAAQPPFGRLAKLGPNTDHRSLGPACRTRRRCVGADSRRRGGARCRAVLRRGPGARVSWGCHRSTFGRCPDRPNVP